MIPTLEKIRMRPRRSQPESADAPFVPLSSAWLGDAPGRFAPENYQTAGSGVKEMGRARRAPWGNELHFLLPGLGLLGFSRRAHRLPSRASSRKSAPATPRARHELSLSNSKMLLFAF